MAKIESNTRLRELYPEATGRAVTKEMTRLDKHSRRFIELSPFLILGTMGGDGQADVSPRGETPGFVQAPDDKTLLIPDRPGNNRLDSMTNLLSNPALGLLFLIPGVQETLRINGQAEVRDDPELLARFEVMGKPPRTVLAVTIEQAYLHCAKSILRSRIWDDQARIDRRFLPTMNEMLGEQIGLETPPEPQEAMIARYNKELF